MAQSLEAKIVVLGAQGVGKTSLVHRFVKNQFSPANVISTVGASFLTKRVLDDESETVVRLQIWDTAGQERFRSISRLYYRGANACILCYSITDSKSFTEMGVWLTELRRNLPPDIILHVVGTKSDLVNGDPSARQVPFERCIAYVAENLMPGMSGTPPATAGIGSESGGSGEGRRSLLDSGVYRSFLGRSPEPTPAVEPHYSAGITTPGFTSLHHPEGALSPSSKRSSGFWGQEVGWDCCHEISAESGEGVDEVFRVITRKLVEQDRKAQAQLMSAAQTPGMTPGVDGGMEGYFDARVGGRPGGSFRVGRDRRSWFGVPVESYIETSEGGAVSTPGEPVIKTRRQCC